MFRNIWTCISQQKSSSWEGRSAFNEVTNCKSLFIFVIFKKQKLIISTRKRGLKFSYKVPHGSFSIFNQTDKYEH